MSLLLDALQRASKEKAAAAAAHAAGHTPDEGLRISNVALGTTELPELSIADMPRLAEPVASANTPGDGHARGVKPGVVEPLSLVDKEATDISTLARVQGAHREPHRTVAPAAEPEPLSLQEAAPVFALAAQAAMSAATPEVSVASPALATPSARSESAMPAPSVPQPPTSVSPVASGMSATPPIAPVPQLAPPLSPSPTPSPPLSPTPERVAHDMRRAYGATSPLPASQQRRRMWLLVMAGLVLASVAVCLGVLWWLDKQAGMGLAPQPSAPAQPATEVAPPDPAPAPATAAATTATSPATVDTAVASASTAQQTLPAQTKAQADTRPSTPEKAEPGVPPSHTTKVAKAAGAPAVAAAAPLPSPDAAAAHPSQTVAPVSARTARHKGAQASPAASSAVGDAALAPQASLGQVSPTGSDVVAPAAPPVVARSAKESSNEMGKGGAKGTIESRVRGPSALERGYAALVDARMAEAERAYQEALAANPQERDALLGLAYVAQHQGRAQDARAWYAQVLRLDPQNAAAKAGLLALAGGAEDNLSAGKARELAQQNPNAAATLATVGQVLVREGYLGEAQQVFARAESLEPSNVQYVYNHAVALDRLGQFDAAATRYARVVQLLGAGARSVAGISAAVVQQRLDQLGNRAGQGARPAQP